MSSSHSEIGLAREAHRAGNCADPSEARPGPGRRALLPVWAQRPGAVAAAAFPSAGFTAPGSHSLPAPGFQHSDWRFRIRNSPSETNAIFKNQSFVVFKSTELCGEIGFLQGRMLGEVRNNDRHIFPGLRSSKVFSRPFTEIHKHNQFTKVQRKGNKGRTDQTEPELRSAPPAALSDPSPWQRGTSQPALSSPAPAHGAGVWAWALHLPTPLTGPSPTPQSQRVSWGVFSIRLSGKPAPELLTSRPLLTTLGLSSTYGS